MEPERELEIRSSIKSKYREVAVKADGHFPYPTGRASALKLGYDPYWLELVPDEVLERFVGVGNPFSIHMPKPGKRILDAGCGCGVDAFVSSILVGPEGWVSGVDLTTEMLALPLAISAKSEQWNLEFREASVEDLPYEGSFFDIVISNGVLNLVPDKKAAFGELARVLRPDGILAVADLLVKETIPQDVISSKDAWSTWIAGALQGRDYLTALEESGFRSVEILGKTGYVTSKYTEAFYILAVRWTYSDYEILLKLYKTVTFPTQISSSQTNKRDFH